MSQVDINEAIHWVKTLQTWALVGATPKQDKFANQLLRALVLMGKTVLPVNPAYPTIEGLTSSPSLAALPSRPDVVVFVMSPARMLDQIAALTAEDRFPLWFPPECFDENVVQAVEALPNAFIIDQCPINLGLQAGMLKEKPPINGKGC